MACPLADLTIANRLLERRPRNASNGSATRLVRTLLKGSVQKALRLPRDLGKSQQ